ncbi:HEPN domain-containing protein [Thalassospira indica]|uniref:Apea-like HEPN domain-containing protein n=1 Tax=Thalassospira indica TaxID=1891279 RepID=A0ABN5NJ44_9PROT|nr:HEPN domain-containing protein [Thalassospira indica]AXO14392.1 hypothetical protein DY252_09280 [Thalassospira indica]OAZ11339.1 hypothetical protein TH15_17860 [Thalassospira profundimaris]
MAYYTQIAVFQSRSLKPPLPKIVVHPVKIELVSGPVDLKIPKQHTRIHVLGKSDKLVELGNLHLPKGHNYLILSVQSKDGSIEGLEELNGYLDRTITAVSFLYQPQFFFEQIYRGPLAGSKMAISAFTRAAEYEQIDSKFLADEIRNLYAKFSGDSKTFQRFTLMSKFYRRSLDFDPSEEKFLMLWTAFEVYPMDGTSNIKKLKELIEKITGRTIDEIERNIGIGRLYGLRCNLIHDGRLDKELFEDIFRKLELLLHEVFREMVRLPYSGSLERFFEKN